MKRFLTLGIALGAAAMSLAAFDGPAPLAWRWNASTTVSPNGAPVADRDAIYSAIGSRIYAVKRMDGAQMWRYPAGVPIEGSFRTGVLVDQDLVVAGADNRNVYAVDRVTGAVKWSYPADGAIIGTPVAAGNNIIVPMDGNRIMALDRATGNPAWEGPVMVNSGYSGHLAAYRDNFIFFDDTSNLWAINGNTGREDWTLKLQRHSRSTPPIVFEGEIYVNSGTYAIAVRATNGRVAWQQNTGVNLAFSPAVNTEYVGVVSNLGMVQVLNRNNGRPVTGPMMNLKLPPVTSPTFVGETMVVPTADGGINVLDPVLETLSFSYRIPYKPGRDAPTTGPGNQPGAGAGGGTGAAGAGDGGGQEGGGGDSNTSGDSDVIYIAAAGPVAGAGDSMIVLALDGSILSFDDTTGVDLTAPVVEMKWPGSGETIWGRPPLNFLFTLQDFGSGVNAETVGVTIDGQKYEHILQPDGSLFVVINNSAPNRPLRDGRRVITVSATDWMGNKVEQAFSVIIDNTLSPPSGGGNTGGNQPGRGGAGG